MTFKIVYVRDLAMYVRENNALLIDIRSKSLYEKGHCNGAINMPLETTDSYEKQIDINQEYILYCEHGGNSMKLARYLGKRGYSVASLIGGYQAIKNFGEKCLKI